MGSFPSQLRTLRLNRGLTQFQLAERAGISTKHCERLEHTRLKCNPTLDTVQALALALEVPITDLVGDVEVLRLRTRPPSKAQRRLADLVFALGRREARLLLTLAEYLAPKPENPESDQTETS